MTTQWNWQQPDWPHFRYLNTAALEAAEKAFIYQAGFFYGAYDHISQQNQYDFIVDILSEEAFKTSEIEGEYLNRESIQASIRRQLGLAVDNRKIPPAAQGVSEMMVDIHRHFQKPLDEETLFNWHKMLTNGRRDLFDIGQYRTHDEPMQIISGSLEHPKIHFEAPPSANVPQEMKKFIIWFNDTALEGKSPLGAITRAAIAHWYFVSIHPFEDGNGRIARALVIKALSQSIKQPVLISLSHWIQQNKKSYYACLANNNTSNEITSYLSTFTTLISEAQEYTQKMIRFIIAKYQLYARVQNQLNARQQKVIEKMFSHGIEGQKKGITIDLYLKITETSRATANRDLNDLIEKAVLKREGEHKKTRYILNLPS
jgi:Fic family protein